MDKTQSDQLKKNAALAALKYLPAEGIIGVGTGSTVKYFIDAIADPSVKHKIEGAIPSSHATLDQLKSHQIPILDLNSAGTIPVYFDGTDSVDKHLNLLKGGGAALTREKIIAAASKKFVCMADESKFCSVLNCDKIPISVEVIPMARSFVAREIVKLKGVPVYREGVITDNGNVILDVYQLDLTDPLKTEEKLNQLTGVVCHGLFAKRKADILLLASPSGIQTIEV
jgi:ribose 5-phosphate isomerase A